MKKEIYGMTTKELCINHFKEMDRKELSKSSFIYGTLFGFMLMGLIFSILMIIFANFSVPKFNTIVFRDVNGKLSVTQYKTYTENKNDGTIEFEAKDGTIYTTIDDYIILNAK